MNQRDMGAQTVRVTDTSLSAEWYRRCSLLLFDVERVFSAVQLARPRQPTACNNSQNCRRAA